MLDYVSSDTVCRSRMLLHYFGEKNEHNCGQCDTCINLKNKKPSGHLSEKELSEKILQALSDKQQTPATLAEQIPDDKNMLIDVLHELLDEGKVIAVNGMIQIKKLFITFAVGKECPAADEEHLLSAMLLLFLFIF